MHLRSSLQELKWCFSAAFKTHSQKSLDSSRIYVSQKGHRVSCSLYGAMAGLDIQKKDRRAADGNIRPASSQPRPAGSQLLVSLVRPQLGPCGTWHLLPAPGSALLQLPDLSWAFVLHHPPADKPHVPKPSTFSWLPKITEQTGLTQTSASPYTWLNTLELSSPA